jgi:hypothetical protein
MNKSNLQTFINRYYLAGNCEAVTVKPENDGVRCDLIDLDQTVVGSVKWKCDPFFKGTLGINHTGTLNKMLSAIGDDIDIAVKTAEDKNYSLVISDKTTKMTFMLADTSVIPAVPSINTEPDYEVTIPLDEDFTNRFIKAKNALPDAKKFAVQVQNGVIRFIINYSTINADNITFDIPGHAEELTPICYPADKLKEILTANKGEKGVLKVSSAGLAKVEFRGTNFESDYYLVQLQN